MRISDWSSDVCSSDLGIGGKITIAGGELRQEAELIAAARENARVLASAINVDAEVPSYPIVERTAAKLRKAKPASMTGLVSVEGAGLIKAEVAPASIDRLETALNRSEEHTSELQSLMRISY